MKAHLRRGIVMTFVVLLAVSGAVAQGSKHEELYFNQKRTFEAFEMNLGRDDVPGFVESSLYAIAECKEEFPNLDYSGLLDAVNRVARDNGDSSIRYKAYLVSVYLTHASDIIVSPVRNADDHNYLFKQIADQLEQKFLAYRTTDGVVEK